MLSKLLHITQAILKWSKELLLSEKINENQNISGMTSCLGNFLKNFKKRFILIPTLLSDIMQFITITYGVVVFWGLLVDSYLTLFIHTLYLAQVNFVLQNQGKYFSRHFKT